MPAEFGIDAISGASGDFADCRGDVTESTAGHRRGDAGVKGSLGRLDQCFVSGVGSVADDDRDRRIGYPAVDRHREVQTQHVAITEYVVAWHAVQHSVVDRQTDDVPEWTATE